MLNANILSSLLRMEEKKEFQIKLLILFIIFFYFHLSQPLIANKSKTIEHVQLNMFIHPFSFTIISCT